MLQEIPEELSEHVSVVRVDKPSEPPYSATVEFEADFQDGTSVRISASMPLKPIGAATAVPLLSDEQTIVSRAMNTVLRTPRELGPAG